ncbi:MAG: hypothetical protein C0478_18330 [Planctomyces sp.]|nr:hypothetical protein [Planctomyces sp.]
MPSIVDLSRIQLIPVIELEPMAFSTRFHSMLTEANNKDPDELDHCWRVSLADSGVSGINPMFPGSWLVCTSDVTSTKLANILRVIIDKRGGVSSLNNPRLKSVLSGGLALISDEQGILIEPTCCGDLGDIVNWKEAASYEGEEWKMLWIGHPWVSMKFQRPWLLLSDFHESSEPVERWAVMPHELMQAVNVAEAELIRFSKQIVPILLAWDYQGDAVDMSLRLVGLGTE